MQTEAQSCRRQEKSVLNWTQHGTDQAALVRAPYFDGAKLLIAVTAAHTPTEISTVNYPRSCRTLIGCPKLDDVDYSEKLTEIIKKQ